MPNTDFRKKHRLEWKEFLWNQLLDKLMQTKSKTEFKELLESFITEYEKDMITRRLAAMILIQKGLSYQEIGEILWLSPVTISTMKKNLLGSKSGYKSRRKVEKKPSETHTSKKQEVLTHQTKLNKLMSLIERIAEPLEWMNDFLEKLTAGYSDPKKRWDFLSRYK